MTHFDEMIVLDHGSFYTKGQPHPDARRVWGFDSNGDGKQAGWLMPQVQEVDDKTERFYRERDRRNARAAAKRIEEHWLRTRT